MKKKIILTLVYVISYLFIFSQQSSWNLYDSPTDENLQSVCFVDADHGWIVSDEGTLIYTNDGGESWQNNNLGGDLESVNFSDENHGCIVGWTNFPSDSSLILITADGGENWLPVEHVKVNRLNDVFFINNSIGWAVGSKDEWI